MSDLGLGVMIHMLSGGSRHETDEFYGQKIIKAEIVDEQLRLDLEDGVQIQIWDNGQSCCEFRYMTCDDEVQSLQGHTLSRIEAKDGPDEEGEYEEVHESVFVEVGTDDGFITITNHNEHNGYYGGFELNITSSGGENAK